MDTLPQSDRAVADGLAREEQGKAAFTKLIRQWLARSGWSLQVAADLCEVAVRHSLAQEIEEFQPGFYTPGDLVVASGSVWRCIWADNYKAEPKKDDEDRWERVASLRRLYPSQLHQLQLGKALQINATVFQVLGCLNQYLADLRRGRAKLPKTLKLIAKASEGVVIEDEDGPYGPEEFLSVYLGRLQPPFSIEQLTEQQASSISQDLARRIRAEMRDAGLDLIDDWAQFVALYPTSDSDRLAKIRDVALGAGYWSPEQVDDELAAVEIALRRLKQRLVEQELGQGPATPVNNGG